MRQFRDTVKYSRRRDKYDNIGHSYCDHLPRPLLTAKKERVVRSEKFVNTVYRTVCGRKLQPSSPLRVVPQTLRHTTLGPRV